jgi:hypothetical protein
MLPVLVRLECLRQSLGERLLSTSSDSATKYHCIMAFAVALLAWPVVPITLGIEPGGISLLTAEAGIFVAILAFGVFLVVTAIFSPVGLLIL